jgi:RND family efflux transporter MFP subunit
LKENQSAIAELNPERIESPAERRPGRKAKWFWLLGLFIVGAAAVFIVLRSLKAPPPPASPPTVAAAKVIREDLYNEVPIPAEFRPYVQSELHAMVTGYVSEMNVDFGDKVKKGDVLAVLEVPQLTDELHLAQARQRQAEADYTNAHLIYTRMEAVQKERPALVAQQDVDTVEAKDASTFASVGATKADVAKYETLVNYTKIIAPFDGVITKRSVDPGALVQAGTSSDRSMPLLRISDNYYMRLDFPVSVDYVQDVKVGDSISVRVESLGGKTLKGKITRFTDEVNDQTRTMITEIEMPNPNLEIVPGMYAVALFKFKQRPHALTIPSQAVRNPKEPIVDVITAGNIIEARTVTLGLEMSDRYEVTSGLKEGELVVIGNGAQAQPGQKVEPKLTKLPAIPPPMTP